MRRGAVRDAILRVLADEPMHGYQVMQELGARTGGRWQPSAGSVYPTLQQLEDEGLVSGADHDGRRTFALTDAGRAAAAALPTVGPWSQRGRGDDLRGLARELGIAAVQVSRVGSPAAVDEARTILTDARKALYRILADDQPSDDDSTG
jgi:DNA-binding PadR family transcriptional regulator